MNSRFSASQDHFRALVEQALDELPDQLAALLDNIYVEIEEKPTTEDLASVGMKPTEADELLGLYQGTPLAERGFDYSGLPDRVVIFSRPILLICATDGDVRREVRDTVVHELGHHFGLSDEEMVY